MAIKDIGYLGNAQLKKVGTNIEWTTEMVQEWEKCKNDPVYFTKNYIKIINLNDGLVNFVPYDYQEEILKTVHENRYTIITTGRQAGKCVGYNTGITVKNKKTGVVEMLKIGKFFNKINSN